MITKNEKNYCAGIRWMPPLKKFQSSGKNQYGWIYLFTGDRAWEITNWHSFDDKGQTIETLTIERDGDMMELYSHDEGETFTFDMVEA